jgi:cation diffusion facilitator CzcD-associated flavoprotein CzcO/acetyl esterase/lipase
MHLTLPRPVVRALVRATVAPVLSPRIPVGAQRRLLDLSGRVLPLPRGTRSTASSLGGVPSVRITTAGSTGSHVVLFLHGGGYTTGSPASHLGLGAGLAEASGAPVHLLHYRRAPEHPYPAAVDDAHAAFRALVEAGQVPQRIILAGDSAGAGIAVALLLRLRDAGEELPGTVGLISPWLDLDLTDPAVAANTGRDAMLDPRWLRRAAVAYRAGSDSPGLRPLEADLSGLPPLHVVAGADEILVGDAERLVRGVTAVGGRADLHVAPGMWHDHLIFAGLLGQAAADLRALGAALRADVVARRPRVAVVGTGFGGIGMGAALRADGLADTTLFEKADGVGGVWRDNTYPGAACDVPSHLYSYSFAPGREWSRRFAPQPDILRYLRRVTAEHGLEPDLRLHTEITEARFDEERAVWRLATGAGETVEADALVSACGQLSRPAEPDLPGLASFRGPVFHSARWDHDVDLRGKRVAVVGTGASAIQFVPAIAGEVTALTVFQRSAPYLIPKPDRRYGPRALALFQRFPMWRTVSRGFWGAFFEFGALGLTSVRAAATPFRLAYAALVRAQLPDPELRARVEPDYPVGCKRILISSDWFRALAKPHVDVETAAIAEVTPDGIRTADGVLHPVDVIVFGTGFRTNDFLAPMKVFGRGGAELSEQWRDGARAHLGITVPGFPNLFLLYGPNTNVGSGSIVHMLECQIRYVREGIRRLAAGVRTLEVREDAATDYDVEIQDRLTGSVWTECSSWYRDAEGRIVNNWPGTMTEYRRRTRTFDAENYRAE